MIEYKETLNWKGTSEKDGEECVEKRLRSNS